MAKNRKTVLQKFSAFCLCMLIVCGNTFHHRPVLGLDAVGSLDMPTVTSTDFGDISFDPIGDDMELDAITPPSSTVKYKNVVLSLAMKRGDIDHARLEWQGSNLSRFRSPPLFPGFCVHS